MHGDRGQQWCIWFNLAALSACAVLAIFAAIAAFTGEWWVAAMDGALAVAGFEWVHERMTTTSR